MVIAESGRELGAGDIDDALAGTGRYLMNETYDIVSYFHFVRNTPLILVEEARIRI